MVGLQRIYLTVKEFLGLHSSGLQVHITLSLLLYSGEIKKTDPGEMSQLYFSKLIINLKY